MYTDKYKISIIIPVYNTENYLRSCLESVIRQNVPLECMQVIMINDGSTDNSFLIMEEYSRKYPKSFIAVNKKNEGVAATRNLGIKMAEGKYIMYLDSDDTISAGTVQGVISFFDRHYDEIDIMTYDQVSVVNGEKAARHYRYRTFTHSGVYDLNELSNAFASVTNISVVVKNLYKTNILFDENMKAHEDMFYCTHILSDKMKIGFTTDGCYEYNVNPNSAVHTTFYAYYIFEQTTSCWERLFATYSNTVPYYIQALFLNDISWKTRSYILMPYHYNKEKLQQAEARIVHLLQRVDDKIIVLHPGVDKFHQQYFLRMKGGAEDIRVAFSPAGFVALRNNHVLFYERGIELVLQKFRVAGNEIEIMAYLKSQFFSVGILPKLYMRKDGDVLIGVELGACSWDYYKAKTKTNTFYGFRMKLNINEIHSFEFLVQIDEMRIPVSYYFMPQVFFDRGRNTYFIDDHKISFLNGIFLIEEATEGDYKKHKKNIKRACWRRNKKTWAIKSIMLSLPSRRNDIWLYSDAKGVKVDNGFYQFHHDVSKVDGIKRYYITSYSRREYKEALSFRQRRRLVRRGSWRHKYLYLRAQKAITAFIEFDNYCPFNTAWYHNYMDVGTIADVIYLQHGVLHAHCPWKYSLDRVLVQKEVISTVYEKRNMVEQYLFDDEHLLQTGMPRYDYMDTNKKGSNRILYAPSWRKYLIRYENDNWAANPKKFLASDFYRETQAFLSSRRLHKLLETYDYTLDFKLHPIFETYKDYYNINTDRVCLAPSTIPNAEYKVFITDFSSFVYDFAYLKRAILYFNPDYHFFLAGMNDYRELDLPYEEAFGPFVQTAEEALDEIEKILSQNAIPAARYWERMEHLFFYKDNNQCERIYEQLK